MDNSRPDARPVKEVRNGNEALPQNRGNAAPPFKNQVDDRGQLMNPQDVNGKTKGPSGEMSRNQMGAQEAVGQLIWNQPPRQHPENTSIERAPRQDRVHPNQRHAAPLFQAEYGYPTSNSPPYIRDEVTPSPDATPPPRERKGNRKRDPDPPPAAVMIPASKIKFGFSTATILIIIQCILIFLFGVFVSYGDDVRAVPRMDQKLGKREQSNLYEYHSRDHVRLQKFYSMFQDVHVMIFIGFGFLMTFLRKYGYSAVGYNMLIAAIAIQWSILCRGVFRYKDSTIQISIENLINGDFAAGAVLISFGALLGVTNPLQLVTMCLIEVFLYALNEYIGTELFEAIDIGGSLFIHAFGAYFGLALSLTMRRQKDIDTKHEKSSYNSDIFAMIGTVFLWLFWPSFNGVMAVGDDQHRAVLNTVLSLSGSCIFSFAASSLMCPENKFSMVHVQNASLAGGVAVGAVADLMIQPFGALAIGSMAGLLSTAGYVYLTPMLQRKIGLHDTCGVHNLHGMPGVMGGLISVLMAAIATEDMYGTGLFVQYPARSPMENSQALKEATDLLVTVQPGEGRTASGQALFQLAALFTTIAIAVVGGAVTGLMFRIPFFGKVPNEALFNDAELWEVPEEEGKEHGELGSENKSYGALGSTNLQLEVTQKVD